MKCLEVYRSKLVRDTNRQLRVILDTPDESAVHDFRVGIKRLTALYGFLGRVDEKLSAKKLLKPYRVKFKCLGNIRDAHIAIGLIENSGAASNAESKRLIGLLNSGIRRDFRRFRKIAGDDREVSIKLPTLRATGLSQVAISKHKPVHLERLLSQILADEKRMTVDEWHRKRILLKRYRHILDAFSLCPGQAANASLLKQITLLEQLLGDWHDRVVTAELLQSLSVSAPGPASLIRELNSQHRTLLGAATIYLDKFTRAQRARAPVR